MLYETRLSYPFRLNGRKDIFMSETLSECVVHPTEDADFQRSVLRALLGRRVIGLVCSHPQAGQVPDRFVKALGADEARATLVNDCVIQIANGTCTNFIVSGAGSSIEVTRKEA